MNSKVLLLALATTVLYWASKAQTKIHLVCGQALIFKTSMEKMVLEMIMITKIKTGINSV